MSFQGHLVCHTCRVQLSLGKVLSDDAGSHTGFSHAKYTDDELGRISLAFIATHIKHDLVCLGDTRLYDMDDLPSYDMLMRMPPESPFAVRNAPISLAGIDVWRLPCESLADRASRDASAAQTQGTTDRSSD